MESQEPPFMDMPWFTIFFLVLLVVISLVGAAYLTGFIADFFAVMAIIVTIPVMLTFMNKILEVIDRWFARH